MYWKQPYLDFIASPIFEEKKRKNKGIRCDNNYSHTSKLQLHHINYKYLVTDKYGRIIADNTPPSGFLTLCNDCHTWISIDPKTGLKRSRAEQERLSLEIVRRNAGKPDPALVKIIVLFIFFLIVMIFWLYFKF